MRVLKIIIVGWLSMGIAYALTSDNKEPVVITSNSLSGDLNKRMAVFNGNVIAAQGTRELTSDQAYMYFDTAGQITLIKAVGNPAKTTEILDAKGTRVYGQALIIEYFPPQSFIQYEQQAILEENGNIFKGNLITYNIVQQVVASPLSKDNTGTTTIILPPEAPKIKS